jgi:fermentation-respiration switch protein FrsA (DUF1100 family)
MPRRLRVVAIVVLGALIAAYLAANAYLWTRQRQLIFEPAAELARTPADVALRYEDVNVVVGKAHGALHGWWLQAADAQAPVVLYLHGNDLNLGAEVDHVAALYRLGLSVLAVDYRGFGKSQGAFPSESQVYEDADAAWSYLVATRRVDPDRIFIYGHSLGAAVAIELAVRHPDAAGIVAEGGFTSMRDMAARRYWMFPVDWILRERFDSLAKVANLRIPVLFIHGMADDEVPYEMSQRLYAAAPARKSLLLIPGADHENSAAIGGARYERALLDFVSGNRDRRIARRTRRWRAATRRSRRESRQDGAPRHDASGDRSRGTARTPPRPANRAAATPRATADRAAARDDTRE